MSIHVKAIALLLSTMVATAVPQSATARPAISVDVDSGTVISAHEIDRSWHPASVTKLMTALIAFEMIKANKLTMSSPVVFSEHAASTPPSKLGVSAGSTIPLEQALRIMLTRSMNDVAVAIAETVAGNETNFARLMNLKATSIGMRGTRFVNASGLHDPRQVSTAADLAILGRHIVLDFPDHADLFGMPSVSYGKKVLKNTNGLVGHYAGARGLKTGYVCAAGFNLVGYAERDGRRIVTVVLGAPSARQRERETTQLLEEAFAAGGGLVALTSGAPAPSAAIDLRSFGCGKELREKGSAASSNVTAMPIPLRRPQRQWAVGGSLEEYGRL
jgi:D-alanyl-D-alanine carboxypeptidase|nr:D-alanyl-D-alanine carboxypeptidase family protein [Neorhizobium tomejilense]